MVLGRIEHDSRYNITKQRYPAGIKSILQIPTGKSSEEILAPANIVLVSDRHKNRQDLCESQKYL